MSAPFASRGDALAWAAFGLIVAFALGLSAHRALISPRGRVIFEDASAPWITAAEPFSANLRQWGRRAAPVTRFTRSFVLAEVDRGARLRWRAFGHVEILLNGHPFELRPADPHWRRFRELDVTAWLRPGANELEVRVRNRHGPALLSLRLETGESALVSDGTWQAAQGRRVPAPAEPALDLRPHPDAGVPPTPARALAERWRPLSVLLALMIALALLMRARLSRLPPALPVVAALALAGAAWLALFVTKLGAIPLRLGFDARRQMDYVELLREQARIPLAAEGWSMYHPPLYHLLVAALSSVGDAIGPGFALWLAKLPAFAAGLGTVWLSLRLVQRLHPGESGMALAALGFAAVLPMNVYLAAYVSNESLLALLSAGALLAAVELMLEREISQRRLGILSLWLGLALLTKYTALVLVAITLVFASAKLWLRRGEGGRRLQLRRGVLLLGPMLVLAGWFYLRNQLAYGRPLVPNWDLPGADQVWWSPPGFHTPAYYLHFGESLVHPWFSAFASFWDAIYSTLWGDGLAAGSADLRSANPQWSYGWMSAGYLLAVPLCALLLLGAGELVRRVLRDPDPGRRAAQALLLVFAAALGFGVFYTTLSLPYFGQAKAFYALSATPVLALCFAHGWRTCDLWLAAPRLRWLRAGISGSIATALCVLFLGFIA